MTSIGTLAKVDSNDLNKSIVGPTSPTRTPDTVNRVGSSQPKTTISSAGRLQHALSKLTDSLHKLSEPKTWNASKARSNAPEIVEVTATLAPYPTQMSVRVEQVAKAQSVTQSLQAPLSAPVGLGVLTFELGNWGDDFQSFTPNPNWPKAAISTGPGDTSITKLRDKINAAGLGVVANVISAPTGNYLILAASSTGQDNGFRVTAEPDPSLLPEQAQQFKRLAFDPAQAPGGMQLTQSGQDAIVNIDGKERRSANNFMANASFGVDITARAPSSSNIEIRVDKDEAPARQVLKDFADAYNDLNEVLRQSQQDQTKAYALAQNARNSVASIWSEDSPHQVTRQELERLGLSLDASGTMRWDADQFARNQAGASESPVQVQALTKELPRASTESNATGVNRQDSQSPNTTPLFRQAVIGHYANNMYLEDVN